MQRLIAAIFFTLLCTFSVFAQNTVQDYVNKYHKTAIVQMERTGIPASILLSSGILESYIGNSQLALQANNHFNIKCQKNWNGEFFYQWEKDQTQKPSCYRVYELPEESYLEYANYLMAQESLSALLMYNSKSYKQWASELAKLNITARLSDVDQILRLIEEFELYAFDNQASKNEDRNKYEYSSRKIHDVHGLKAIIALADDTPLGVASEFKIPYRKVLKYNDLETGEGFVDGQFVFLEPKRNNAEMGIEFHEVRSGETIYDISQLYGIKLKSLLKFNHVSLEDKIATGELVYLKDDAPVRPRLVGEQPIQQPTTKPNDDIIADNGQLAPGMNDKIKIRPQRRPAIPSPVKPKPKVEKKEEPDDGSIGYIDHDAQIEKPIVVVPPQRPTNIVTNEPPKKNTAKPPVSPPGKKSKVDAQSQLEGAPVPIIPDDVSISDVVSNQPPGKSSSSIHPIEEVQKPIIEEVEVKDGYHIVKDGETLYSIAKQYRTNVEAIKYWNAIKNNEVEVGQEIRISGRK